MAPKDLVGMNVYDIFPPDRAVKYEKDLREVMATGTHTYFEESVIGRKGKIRHVEKMQLPP